MVVFHRHLNKIFEITVLQLTVVEASVWYPLAPVTLGSWSDRVYVGAQPLTSWLGSKKKTKGPGPHNPFQGHFFFIDLRTDTRPYILKAPPSPNDAPLGTFDT